MAGRGRMPPHVGHPLSGPGMMHPEAFGPGLRHPLGPHPMDLFPPHPEFLEQKLADQHAEMQRLAAENQRLGATHVALRQELAAAQQELQRVEAQMAAIRNDKEHQIRSIIDKSAKMEAELRGSESLKVELQQARSDTQNLMSMRQDLTTQVQQLTQELQRAHAEIQQVPALHAELEGLRQEFQRARTAFEYEKKATSDQVEQIKAMEKNLYSMAREVEKLRAELVNSPDKRSRAGPYGAGFKDPDVSFVPGGPTTYADGYGISQIPGAAASGAPYGGPATGRGGYDVPRGGGSQDVCQDGSLTSKWWDKRYKRGRCLFIFEVHCTFPSTPGSYTVVRSVTGNHSVTDGKQGLGTKVQNWQENYEEDTDNFKQSSLCKVDGYS